MGRIDVAMDTWRESGAGELELLGHRWPREPDTVFDWVDQRLRLHRVIPNSLPYSQVDFPSTKNLPLALLEVLQESRPEY